PPVAAPGSQPGSQPGWVPRPDGGGTRRPVVVREAAAPSCPLPGMARTITGGRTARPVDGAAAGDRAGAGRWGQAVAVRAPGERDPVRGARRRSRATSAPALWRGAAAAGPATPRDAALPAGDPPEGQTMTRLLIVLDRWSLVRDRFTDDERAKLN